MLNEIFLGIVQGIFEWIPVSSEGILTLLNQYFIKDLNALDFALFLHFGTILSALIYFNKEVKEVITIKNKQLFKFLTITTIVSLIVAFPIYKLINNITIGTTLLIIMGTGLIITSYFHKTKHKFNLSLKQVAILSGILQGLAVIPGLSRSGSTIFGLSLGKLNPKQILTYSYLMSIPIVIVSTIYLILKDPQIITAWPALVSSFIIGLLTLHILIKFSQRINFFIFTLIFGLLCYAGAIINLL